MGLFDTLFSSNKLTQPLNLSDISADVHAHIIPEIDDGCRNIEESLEMIRSLRNLGYRKIIATPHIFTDYFKNTPEIILNGLEKLRTAVQRANIPMQIEAGAEYMFDDSFVKNLNPANLLTFGNKYVLIELPPLNPPRDLFKTLFELKLEGINPIIAHPERYGYWYDNLENYITLKDREILLQVNLPSLSGFYAGEVRKMAEKLIDNNLIDFAGTDLHNAEYLKYVDKSRFTKSLAKLILSGKLLNNTL